MARTYLSGPLSCELPASARKSRSAVAEASCSFQRHERAADGVDRKIALAPDAAMIEGPLGSGSPRNLPVRNRPISCLMLFDYSELARTSSDYGIRSISVDRDYVIVRIAVDVEVVGIDPSKQWLLTRSQHDRLFAGTDGFARNTDHVGLVESAITRTRGE